MGAGTFRPGKIIAVPFNSREEAETEIKLYADTMEFINDNQSSLPPVWSATPQQADVLEQDLYAHFRPTSDTRPAAIS